MSIVCSMGVWGVPSVGSRRVLTACSRERSRELFAQRHCFAPCLPPNLISTVTFSCRFSSLNMSQKDPCQKQACEIQKCLQGTERHFVLLVS